jgi:hypothetical protein
MLGLAALSHNSLRSLRSLRSNRMRQVRSRGALRARATNPGLAGRAGPGGPAARKAQTVHWTVCVRARLLGGAKARCRLPRAFAEPPRGSCFAGALRWWPSRQAVPGRGDFWGGEERRPGVGARSALRNLTRRICPSAANEVSVASYAARPQVEHRSAVGATRRPTQHEPLPGAACRDADKSRKQCRSTRRASREARGSD